VSVRGHLLSDTADQPTVADYAKGKKAGDTSIGMFDPKDRLNRARCREKPDDQEVAWAA
jgi:hypothetical protein